MPEIGPQEPDFALRVQQSFARQKMMQTLGATVNAVRPGFVEISLPFQDRLTQQHGFLHAAAVAAIADNACGYAALTLAPAEAAVLTIEYKINLLSPAAGEQFLARGRVIKPGRTIAVCEADVFACSQGKEDKAIAKMVASIMIVRDRQDLSD